jgi:NAD-dependent SIR2 family protein deacetylase
MTMDQLVEQAALLIRQADAVAIFAGAGMGVDSGLEQYRGTDSLWTRSITVNNQEINYYDLMKPLAFREQPELAWGLIGNRMEKYSATTPHDGFAILKELVLHKEYFIVTSNIDEQFQKAGFNTLRIFEFHGSIFNTQCGERMECGTWRTPYIKSSPESIHADPPFPECSTCYSYCRPNVLLFEDENFAPDISAEQQFRYMEWREQITSRLRKIVALEIGAGKTLPTIRRFAERFAGDDYPLIRRNPFDSETEQPNHISIPLGAGEGLRQVKDFMERLDFQSND